MPDRAVADPADRLRGHARCAFTGDIQEGAANQEDVMARKKTEHVERDELERDELEEEDDLERERDEMLAGPLSQEFAENIGRASRVERSDHERANPMPKADDTEAEPD
jgi:hypothetical protein